MGEAVTGVALLDHGYVELIEHWGSDERIVETARVSTQKGFLGWGGARVCSRCGRTDQEIDAWGHGCGSKTPMVERPGDERLLSYLATHHHDTPFEFAGATFEVQAPIFVFREWHRHRTQSYSEASARYAPLPDFNFVPTVERLMAAQDGNRQAGAIKGSLPLTPHLAAQWRFYLERFYREAETLYQQGLAAGIPKELARLCLPVGRYSKMRASTDLRNWIGFLALRTAPNAQAEIRAYAGAIETILTDTFPRTMALFNKEKQR